MESALFLSAHVYLTHESFPQSRQVQPRLALLGSNRGRSTHHNPHKKDSSSPEEIVDP